MNKVSFQNGKKAEFFGIYLAMECRGILSGN